MIETTSLSDDELLRYSRHLLLEDFPIELQLRLKQSYGTIRSVQKILGIRVSYRRS